IARPGETVGASGEVVRGAAGGQRSGGGHQKEGAAHACLRAEVADESECTPRASRPPARNRTRRNELNCDKRITASTPEDDWRLAHCTDDPAPGFGWAVSDRADRARRAP